jgi:transcription elongation factor Elf1
MTEPRQRNIPLDINERHKLDQHKRHYENQTGDTGDWGKFLGTVTLAGLAALGIYTLARAAKRAPTVWQVDCPLCSTMFPIQVPNPPPWRVTQVACPRCNTELVIDFAAPASSPLKGYGVNESSDRGTVYAACCHHCRQPIEVLHPGSRINSQGVEYVRCPTCGKVAIYAVLEVK